MVVPTATPSVLPRTVRYNFSMEQPESRDLTNISFDDFVALIFNPAEQFKPDVLLPDMEINAQSVCAYYVQLFQQPEFLTSRFTKQELEEGFWEIMGYTHDWSLGDLIDYSNAPLSSRKECIESMALLFEHLFARELWIPLFICGGILSAIRGTAGIESESAEARTWSYRIPISRPSPRFWRLIPGFVRVPRSMGWAIFTIPTPLP